MVNYSLNVGPCDRMLNSMKKTTQSLLGMLIPECDTDGNFSPRQCHGSGYVSDLRVNITREK